MVNHLKMQDVNSVSFHKFTELCLVKFSHQLEKRTVLCCLQDKVTKRYDNVVCSFGVCGGLPLPWLQHGGKAFKFVSFQKKWLFLTWLQTENVPFMHRQVSERVSRRFAAAVTWNSQWNHHYALISGKVQSSELFSTLHQGQLCWSRRKPELFTFVSRPVLISRASFGCKEWTKCTLHLLQKIEGKNFCFSLKLQFLIASSQAAAFCALQLALFYMNTVFHHFLFTGSRRAPGFCPFPSAAAQLMVLPKQFSSH